MPQNYELSIISSIMLHILVFSEFTECLKIALEYSTDLPIEIEYSKR